MSARLLSQKCIPCNGNTPPLTESGYTALLAQIDGWVVEEGPCILKVFKFRSWKRTIGFVNRISAIAEAEGHHPTLYVSWGTVEVYIWTNAINALTENDFVLAAKIDQGEIDHAAAVVARAEAVVSPGRTTLEQSE